MNLKEKVRSLRRELGLTQAALAERLGVTRASIGAYEEGRAMPSYQFLLGLADLAGTSVDDLLRDAPRIKIARTDLHMPGKIPLVPVKAAAGYQKGFPDEEYVSELPHITLPLLGKGNFRAFEITGDSMLPLLPGTIVIGEKLERLSDLRDGKTYVLITHNEGIVYKRVFNNIREEGVLSLVSDNPRFKSYNIDPMEIHEAWAARAYISLEFPEVFAGKQGDAG
ncbi:MAG TPA: LexA family transcriptional regulator [Cyclobacteriaceae bacterium]|nr:LexA family transcriptional regulator [Cyclobacteriaceae bacterium]